MGINFVILDNVVSLKPNEVFCVLIINMSSDTTGDFKDLSISYRGNQ